MRRSAPPAAHRLPGTGRSGRGLAATAPAVPSQAPLRSRGRRHEGHPEIARGECQGSAVPQVQQHSSHQSQSRGPPGESLPQVRPPGSQPPAPAARALRPEQLFVLIEDTPNTGHDLQALAAP